MKEALGAAIIAGAVAVTAGGGISIATDSLPEAALVALAVGVAFRLGSWFEDRRVAALVRVVQSFCEETAAYYHAREDGRIDDEEARQIAAAVDRFYVDLEAAGAELLKEAPCRTS
jgi:uncharacterized membrane protein